MQAGTNRYGLDSLTRELVVVICNMMFGAGKSRLGEELCNLYKKLKEMGPEGLAALGCRPTITNFVGKEENLEMLSSMEQIYVNFKNTPPRVAGGVSLQQALVKSILQNDGEEYCKFQEWIKKRKTRPRDPAGPGKYELMLHLGGYIKDAHKDCLVMIHLDEVSELLVQSYPDYKEVEEECDDHFKRHVKRARVLWDCLLRLLLTRGVLLFLSGKDTAFHSLGKKRLGPSYKPPSAWKIIPLNPFKTDHLWAILKQTDGLKELGWAEEKDMDIKGYFVDRLQERTSGVPLLVHRVLVWFVRDKPQEILQSIRTVDEFFEQNVPEQLRTSNIDQDTFSPLKNLSAQSRALQHFYLKLLSLAYFKIPIERATSLRMDLIGLGGLRSEVDIVEAVDITGFYLQDEGDHSLVVAPPYCLMLMHDIAQFVTPFIPRSFLGANRQVLDPGGTLKRMTRMALRTLFSPYASTKRNYESIPCLSETCIAQLPIQPLSEEEISLPKLVGAEDSPRDSVQLAGNKAIEDQRRQLEQGKPLLQCHWYCFDLINATLIKDNTLCYSKDKSHGADEQIRLFERYHIFFQDIFSSTLTAKIVQEEADKVYKSISRVPEAQAILILIPLTVEQELQKAASKSDYLHCAPNSSLCNYVLPDLHIVILLEESLRAFLGG